MDMRLLGERKKIKSGFLERVNEEILEEKEEYFCPTKKSYPQLTSPNEDRRIWLNCQKKRRKEEEEEEGNSSYGFFEVLEVWVFKN